MSDEERDSSTMQSLRAENADLKARLAAAEQSLALIAGFLSGDRRPGTKPLPPLRPGLANDIARVLGDLFEFARQIERTVIEFSATFRGALGAKGALLDGHACDMRGLVETLMSDGGSHARERLGDYLRIISRWMVASLAGYKHAAKEWSRQWYERLSPPALERDAKITKIRSLLGMKSYELWRLYREKAQDLDPELIQDQIDEMAAQYAKEFVEKRAS